MELDTQQPIHGNLFNAVTYVLTSIEKTSPVKKRVYFSQRLVCTQHVLDEIESWYEMFQHGETLNYDEHLEERAKKKE